MPGTISASATVSQPLLERHGQRQRQRGDRAGCKDRARRRKSRARRALVQLFGRQRIEHAQQQRGRRERDRGLEARRCGSRARPESRSGRTPRPRSTASARSAAAIGPAPDSRRRRTAPRTRPPSTRCHPTSAFGGSGTAPATGPEGATRCSRLRSTAQRTNTSTARTAAAGTAAAAASARQAIASVAATSAANAASASGSCRLASTSSAAAIR